MRWKWRLGFLVIALLEIPFVLWISTAMAAPPEILLYAGGILALVLLAMLLVRPLLFTFLIVWLGGVVGSAWYFVRLSAPDRSARTGGDSIHGGVGGRRARRVPRPRLGPPTTTLDSALVEDKWGDIRIRPR